MADRVQGILGVEGGTEEVQAVMDLINNAVAGQPAHLVLASLIALLAMGADKVRQLEQSARNEELPPTVNMYGSIIGFDYAIHFRPSEESAEGQAVH